MANFIDSSIAFVKANMLLVLIGLIAVVGIVFAIMAYVQSNKNEEDIDDLEADTNEEDATTSETVRRTVDAVADGRHHAVSFEREYASTPFLSGVTARRHYTGKEVAMELLAQTSTGAEVYIPEDQPVAKFIAELNTPFVSLANMGGIPVIAYVHVGASHDVYFVHAKNSSGSEWNDPVLVATMVSVSAMDMCVAGGVAHIVAYEAGTLTSIRHFTSDTAEWVTTNDVAATTVDLVANHDDTIVRIVSHQDQAVLFVRSDAVPLTPVDAMWSYSGIAWTKTTDVGSTDAASAISYDVTYDEDGLLCLTVCDTDGTNPVRLYRSNDTFTAFGAAEAISTTAVAAGTWARTVLFQGRLHTAFEDTTNSVVVAYETTAGTWTSATMNTGTLDAVDILLVAHEDHLDLLFSDTLGAVYVAQTDESIVDLASGDFTPIYTGAFGKILVEQVDGRVNFAAADGTDLVFHSSTGIDHQYDIQMHVTSS